MLEDELDTCQMRPNYILVSKDELHRQLWNYSNQGTLLRILTFGENHSRFTEWLTAECINLQILSSLVCPTQSSKMMPAYNEKATKFSAIEYERKVFDPYCENEAECRSMLNRIYEEEQLDGSQVTDDMVTRVFEKFCAVKRYILPMLANTKEYAYASFFRHIILYVVRNEEYPDFPALSSYAYLDMPGMSECEINFY